MNKKQHFACGIAGLLGLASTAFAIEPPNTAAPIPPQASPEEAMTPPVEVPHSGLEEVPAPADVSQGYLGVGASQLPELVGEHLKLPEGEGVVIRTLDPDGPATKAGLAQNDIITKVSGKSIGSHEALRAAISGKKPGDQVAVEYFHRGEAKTANVVLGSAPAQPGAIAGADVRPLDNLRMNGMSPEQMKRLREAVEQNMKAFENFDDEEFGDVGALMGNGMRQRMQQMLQGMQMPEFPEGEALNIKGTSSGTIRMMDENGSIELKSNDGKKELRVFGRDGKVQWEGPYNDDKDREKVPQEFRDRVDNLNIDMDFKGNGLRLRMAPGGIR